MLLPIKFLTIAAFFFSYCLALTLPFSVKPRGFKTDRQIENSSLVPSLNTIQGTFPYGCPDSGQYLKPSYISSNDSIFLINNFAELGLMRIADGGTYIALMEGSDAVNLDHAVPSYNLCSQCKIESITIKSKNCFMYNNLAPISYGDIEGSMQEICDKIKDQDIVRVGDLGILSNISTISKNGTNCYYNPNDERKRKGNVCVLANCNNFTMTDASAERQCAKNQSLVTYFEISVNQSEYCNFIPAQAKVRLAAGSALYGAALGCQLVFSDESSLSYALCADIIR